MKGINKAIILGSVGQDPEIRYFPDGKAVTNISVATNEEWKDKSSGQKQTKTAWHRVVIYGKLAEIAGEYIRKGSQVYIEGKIDYKKWQDKQGNDRYTTEIIADKMQMLGGKKTESSTQTNQQQVDDEFIPDDIPF